MQKYAWLLIGTLCLGPVAAFANEADDARAIVDHALELCGSITTYQDRVTIRFEETPKGGLAQPLSLPSHSGSLLFVRPDHFVFKGKLLSIYCDGKTEWDVFEPLGQFIEIADPNPTLLSTKQAMVFNFLNVHPVALALAQPGKKLADLFPSVRELTSVTPEIRGTTPGKCVRGKMSIHTGNGEQLTSFSLWFSDGNGALREVRIDVTAAYNSQMTAARSANGGEGTWPPEKVELVASFDNVILNAKIPPDSFIYKPGPEMHKVTKLDMQKGLRPPVPTEETTTSTLDAPLVEIADERLAELPLDSGHYWGGSIQGYSVDLETNGPKAFVLPEYDSGLCMIPADGEPRHVHFKDIVYPTRLSTFEPVRIDGQLHWFAALEYKTDAGSSQKAVLYNSAGEPIWSYDPPMPKDHGCDLLVTTGDLSGDGNLNYILGIRVSKLRKMEGQSYGWVSSPLAAYLVVLDHAGKLIAQRQVGERLDLIHVLPASQPNHPATIIWVAEGKLRRFQFKQAINLTP